MYKQAKEHILKMEPRQTFTVPRLVAELLKEHQDDRDSVKIVSDVRYAISDMRKKKLVVSTNVKDKDNLMIYKRTLEAVEVSEPDNMQDIVPSIIQTEEPTIKPKLFEPKERDQLLHDLIEEGIHTRKQILDTALMHGHNKSTISNVLYRWMLLKPHYKSPYKEEKRLEFTPEKIAYWKPV